MKVKLEFEFALNGAPFTGVSVLTEPVNCWFNALRPVFRALPGPWM
jgi:hypothetical protein